MATAGASWLTREGQALRHALRLAMGRDQGPPSGWQAGLRYGALAGTLIGLGPVITLWLAAQWWSPAVAVVLAVAVAAWCTGVLRALTPLHLGLLALECIVLTDMASPQVLELNPASDIHSVLLVWAAMGWLWVHAASQLAPLALWHRSVRAADLAWALTGLAVVTLAMWGGFALAGWPTGTLQSALSLAVLGAAVGALVASGLQTSPTTARMMVRIGGLLGWLTVIHPVGHP